MSPPALIWNSPTMKICFSLSPLCRSWNCSGIESKRPLSRRRFKIAWFYLCFVAHGCMVLGQALTDSQSAVDFATEVRPILSDRCFTCHGPDAATRATELRLDQEDSAHRLAVVPGNASQSELMRRVESDDPDLVMPPADTNAQLTVQEREVLRRWIDSGAKFSKHWSFEPLKPVTLPTLPDAHSWHTSDNAVDAFVGNHLLEIGIQPSSQADRAAILRRATLDLIGLLPTTEEVQQFEQSTDPRAYESMLDRLLSSPHFGEKWAVDWLDVARYADTYGYQADVYRETWPWRDWVVEALNQNLPYDQFITWQLAGDLLPSPTGQQIVATAFNRHHRQTNEGGSVEEEFRSEYVADRVNTFGAAFLGLTLECARCHDHKYDPISQREYYQLAAYFNSIDESGLYSHFTSATPTPALALATAEQESRIAQLAAEITAKEQQLKNLLTSDASELSTQTAQPLASQPASGDSGDAADAVHSNQQLREQIEQSLQEELIGHYRFENMEGDKTVNQVGGKASGKLFDGPQLVDAAVGKGLLLSGENNVSVPEGGLWNRHQPFTLSLWLKAPRVFKRSVLLHRSRAWTDAGSRGYELLVEDGHLSAALVHFWPGNAVRVVAKEPLPVDRWCQVTWVYDGTSRASGMWLYLDGQPLETEVVRDNLNLAIHGDEAKELTVGQRFRDVGFKDGQIDELRIFETDLTPLQVAFLYWLDSTSDTLDQKMAEVDHSMWQQLQLQRSAKVLELKDLLYQLRQELSQINESIPRLMVMQELPQRRPTYVLNRGQYDSPGDQVSRGVLENIMPLGTVMGSASHSDLSSDSTQAITPDFTTRLDLDNWLPDPRHPLTARVAVSRIWQSLFGRGLVQTTEDFGFQGAWPMHPQLLDWLAGYYIQTGWDTKGLIKLLMMSQVYRQSSDWTQPQHHEDPENILLARGPSARLTAEMVRDAALQASGLLVTKLGGPPVKPYQPDGLWEEKSGTAYVRDSGEGSRRRSLYTFWKRTSPHPMMMTFDAASREVCVVRRQATMT
ncbi:MAG TPA: hypothetical protein DCF63_06175, partial [Planctomycetaceae bacterium]|nr:hypothetical protein [Planctomycetaceae bacterium]